MSFRPAPFRHTLLALTIAFARLAAFRRPV